MKYLVFPVSLLVTMISVHCCHAQVTWAERLGFPAGQRVVILHANDMGVAYEFSGAGQAALDSGMLQSASVVVPGPWFSEFAGWHGDHHQPDIGISLSFVSPSDAMRWGPVASRDEVPSLVMADGHFAKTVLQFTLRADAKHVRQEAEQQIRLARASGIQPTHLHPHLGCLLTRPDLTKVYLDLAVTHWVPAVMVELTPQLVEKLRAEGFPLDDEVVAMVAKYPLPKLDNVESIPEGESYAATRENFFVTVRGLPPGITQIILNPADETPGLKRLTKKWQSRVWERDLLNDPEVGEFLKKEGIVFTNWRELMERFEETK